jgi:UDP-N-acetylmuramoyl-tripeptide--D-alanyl-D-alanine ligase
MEKSKPLLKTFNIIFPIFDQLYIFQLLEYSTRNYLKTIPRFFLKRNLQKHDILQITNYIRILLITSLFVNILIMFFIYKYLNLQPFFQLLLSLVFLTFLQQFVIITSSVLWKPFYRIKGYLFKKQAQSKISSLKSNGLKVVAITGSYGKTTTKNFIHLLTKDSYITQTIPGNINTAIGITNWINSNIKENTQLLITEMGAYKIGEIKDSAQICPPDIAVITAIGEQHLERFKSIDNIIIAKKEIFYYAENNAKRICPIDLKSKIETEDFEIIYIERKQNLSTNQTLAIQVAKELNIREEIITSLEDKLTPPDRRGNLSEYKGFLLIDNSYNICLDTALYNLDYAKKISEEKNKKIIIVTAGIPEGGRKEKELNSEYSELLSKYGDYIIILNSIYKKLLTQKIDPEKHTFKSSTNEALTFITENFSEKEYLILLQPELTDLYY